MEEYKPAGTIPRRPTYDQFGIFLLGILIGGVFVTFIMSGYWRSEHEVFVEEQLRKTTAAIEAETYRMQRSAVLAKTGVWQAGKDGSPEFRWTICTALGVRR